MTYFAAVDSDTGVLLSHGTTAPESAPEGVDILEVDPPVTADATWDHENRTWADPSLVRDDGQTPAETPVVVPPDGFNAERPPNDGVTEDTSVPPR